MTSTFRVCVSVLCAVHTVVKLSNSTFFTVCLCCYTGCDHVLALLLTECDQIINILINSVVSGRSTEQKETEL